jgi:hypothetical protein
MRHRTRHAHEPGRRARPPSAGPDDKDKDYDMNDHTSGRRNQPRRPRFRRAGVLAAALAGAAVLAAACGSPAKTPGAQSTESPYQQAVAYSKCMRSHGDPAWPDPGSNGAWPNNNGSLDRSSAAYKAAANACKTLGPTGKIPQAVFQRGYRQLLRYSACMRAHGIPKYPDPTLSSTGVSISLQGNIGQHSPQFTAAQQACRSLQPSAGGS